MSDSLYTPRETIARPRGPLIKIAAPAYDEPQGMEHEESHIVRPGSSPPLVFPMCGRCRLPVEKFTIDPMSDPYRLSVDVECCGRHGGAYFTVAELLYKRKHSQPIVFFTET